MNYELETNLGFCFASAWNRRTAFVLSFHGVEREKIPLATHLGPFCFSVRVLLLGDHGHRAESEKHYLGRVGRTKGLSFILQHFGEMDGRRYRSLAFFSREHVCIWEAREVVRFGRQPGIFLVLKRHGSDSLQLPP